MYGNYLVEEIQDEFIALQVHSNSKLIISEHYILQVEGDLPPYDEIKNSTKYQLMNRKLSIKMLKKMG